MIRGGQVRAESGFVVWLTFELKLDDNDEEGDFCMKGGARSGISGKGEGAGESFVN